MKLLFATVAMSACAASTIDLPEPPMTEETAAVVAAYQMPTGTIDVAHMETQLDSAEARLDELHLSWLPDLIADALIGLQERLEDGSLATDPDLPSKESDPKVSAAVTLTRVCRGWDDPPAAPDPATNGTFDLTAVIGGSELRRDIWGTATNCHALVLPRDGGAAQMAFIDGTLILQLEGALPRQPGELNVLFLLSGRLETATQSRATTLDFRIADGQVSFRLPVSDGDIVVSVGLTAFTLRGSNGTFSCDLASHACH